MKQIPGFPGYFADALGNIWSAKRKKIRALKPILQSDGYLKVNLVLPNGKHVSMKVHRAVLFAFRGKEEGKPITRHLDGNTVNNTIENLAWGTGAENYADRISHGTQVKQISQKLTSETVRRILELRARGRSVRELCKTYGVAKSTIYSIGRRNWKSVA